MASDEDFKAKVMAAFKANTIPGLFAFPELYETDNKGLVAGYMGLRREIDLQLLLRGKSSIFYLLINAFLACRQK